MIFFEFQLPNATTWFVFSLLLAVALFWKFSRFLSVRNLDVIALFLLVPGLLLLQESHRPHPDGQRLVEPGPLPWGPPAAEAEPGSQLRALGYVWLLAGSGFLLLRCLVDLVLVRRPALAPNLNRGGLTWLACALFVCLVSVAFRPRGEEAPVGKPSAAVGEVKAKVADAAAAVTGVKSGFAASSGLAILCHLAVAAGLVLIGYRHFHDLHTGVAAATFYLLLPYTALFVGEIHHVLPTALMVWAVVAYRWPMVAGLLFGLAGSMYFPILVVPLWVSFYRGRGAGRFAGAFALTMAVTLAVVGAVQWYQGELADSLKDALTMSDWQVWKAPSSESIWQGIHPAYRIPVFIAYSAFVITTAFWPAPKNLAHVLALSAAVLIGVQFWYADQGGVYVLWYLPFLLLLVFRPNLSERRPEVIVPENDRLAAVGRRLGRLFIRLVHVPEPLARVR